MILYHGSLDAVEKPDISFSRVNTDFGKGFYTTAIKPQAERWTGRFKRRFGYGTISLYEIDEPLLRKNASILEFETYSAKWLEFIAQCRQGGMGGNFDLVIGGVANDDVYNTLTIYFQGYIEKEEAIKRLPYEKPNIQYCFRNQKTIDTYLQFAGAEAV